MLIIVNNSQKILLKPLKRLAESFNILQGIPATIPQVFLTTKDPGEPVQGLLITILVIFFFFFSFNY